MRKGERQTETQKNVSELGGYISLSVLSLWILEQVFSVAHSNTNTHTRNDGVLITSLYLIISITPQSLQKPDDNESDRMQLSALGRADRKLSKAKRKVGQGGEITCRRR